VTVRKKKPTKKATGRKKSAGPAATVKARAKKATVKKPTAKKATAKKATAKKATAKKAVAKNPAARKATTEKSVVKKRAAAKAPAGKPGAPSSPGRPGSPRPLRVAFFGGRAPGEAWLEALADAGHAPVLIVDRPPRDRDEGPGSRPSAIVPWARRHGVEVLTVGVDLVKPGVEAVTPVVERMRTLEIELGVVGGYGRPLDDSIVSAPRLGCIGVHGSLLPRLRGNNPVRAALLEGDRETGVSVYRLTRSSEEDEGNALGGPVLLQEPLTVEPDENYGALLERVGEVGGQLLARAVLALASGQPKLQAKSQDPRRASEGVRATSRHRQAPWWLPAPALFDRLRAFAPEEGLTSMLKRRPIEILWGMPISWENAPFGSTGTYLGMRQGRMAVLCGASTVFGIDRVRWRDDSDREVLSSWDLVYGEKLRPGERFA
jgi:methionyl-tRNA formyltransferase